jgi:predicted amidohydrolase
MKLGVVQPRRDGEDYRRNIETAVDYISRAPEDIDLLMFPEGFPGPWWLAPDAGAKKRVSRSVEDSEAYEAIRDALSGRRTLVGFGLDEKVSGRLYNTYAIVGAKGLVGTYRKLLPAAFELLAASPVSQGKNVLLFNIAGVKVGVSICWEALFPEIPRISAKRGAELLLFPTGGVLYDLKDSWRTVWMARAVENVCYVGANVAIYDREEGCSLIAGPEGVLTETSAQGMISADLDTKRLRWLRASDEELTLPKKYKTVPGLLRWLKRIPTVA